MKKLFFLLLVVNLVIWLWGQREQFVRLSDVAHPGVATLRLVDDAEVLARREETLARSGTPGVATPSHRDAIRPSLAETTAPATPEVHPAVPLAESAEQSSREVAGDVGPAEDSQGAVGAEALVAVQEPLPRAERADTEPVAEDAPSAPKAPVAATALLALEDAASPLPPVDSVLAPGPVAAEAPVADAIEVTPPVAQAAPPAEPAAPDAPSADPSAAAIPLVTAAAEAAPRAPEPLAVAPPADTSSAAVEPPSPPARAREVPYVCESIGPFAERPAAARFQSGLAPSVRHATVREERSSRPVRHWVLAPVQTSKEATAEYLTNLGRAGVKDAWRIPNGPLAGRLAVGVFQTLENARKHANMLAAKGVAAEVQAPKDLEPIRVYWVDYERPADVPVPDPGGDKAHPARQVVARACGAVAGP